MPEKFCKELQLSLNLLDKTENFFSVFYYFFTVNKKIHLYIKASGFQLSCSGTSGHKYERRLAIIIPVIRAVSLCAKSNQSDVHGGKSQEKI